MSDRMRANIDTEGRSRSEQPHSVREDTLQVEYDSSDHDLGVRVVEAVGMAAGIDGMTITTSLSDVIDPEALNSLFAKDGNGRLSFEFIDYHVTVFSFEDGTGQIYVE